MLDKIRSTEQSRCNPRGIRGRSRRRAKFPWPNPTFSSRPTESLRTTGVTSTGAPPPQAPLLPGCPPRSHTGEFRSR